MLSSSPESLITDHHRAADNKSPSPMVSPTVMYKLLIPLLRCEVPDMKDSVIHALGRINHHAIMDMMSELVGYIREAIDRKQVKWIIHKLKSEWKKWDTIKNWPLIFNNFGSIINKLCWNDLVLHKVVIIFSKFHEDKPKKISINGQFFNII